MEVTSGLEHRSIGNDVETFNKKTIHCVKFCYLYQGNAIIYCYAYLSYVRSEIAELQMVSKGAINTTRPPY